jgi:hypothetical protein
LKRFSPGSMISVTIELINLLVSIESPFDCAQNNAACHQVTVSSKCCPVFPELLIVDVEHESRARPFSDTLNSRLRSNLVSSLDFLHVPTLHYFFEDALIQKLLNIVFRYFGITQSDDFLYSS